MRGEGPPAGGQGAAARVRVIPALVLLVGWYLLAAGLLVLAALMMIGLVLEDARTKGTIGEPDLVNVVGLAWVVLSLAYSLGVSSLLTAPVDPASIPVERDPQSELWNAVKEVAKRVGVPVPAEVRLVAQANAWVTERPRAMGLLAGERTLYIGVPLLIRLRTDQLYAVLGHELGHYAGGHTRFGAIAYRGASAFQAAVARLRRGSNASAIFMGMSWLPLAIIGWYARLYYWITFASLRDQEFAADEASAGVVGDPAVTVSALKAVYAHSRAWADFHDRFLAPSIRAGFVPDDPFGAYEEMLRDGRFSEVFDVWLANPVVAPSSRYDSHPSLYERLSRLNTMKSGRATVDPGPAVGSLGRAQAQRAEVARALFAAVRGPGRPFETLAWEKWLRRLGDEEASLRTGRLANAVRMFPANTGRYGQSDRLLGDVLHLLDAGFGYRLAHTYAALTADAPAGVVADRAELAATGRVRMADLVRVIRRRRRAVSAEPVPVSADVAMKLLTESVLLLVSRDLVAWGQSDWRLDWTGRVGAPEAKTLGHVGQAQLRDLVNAAVDRPTEVARLTLYLAELGVNPERVTKSQAASATRPDDATARDANAADDASAGTLASRIRARRERIVAGIAAIIGIFIVTGIVVALRGTSVPPDTPPIFINPAIIPSPPMGRYTTHAPNVIPTDILRSFATK